MTPARRRYVMQAVVLLALILSACTSPTVQPMEIASPTPLISPTAPTNSLATPYALQPAAGICASSDGSVVMVTINPDTPDPRCSKIKRDQTLVVVNHTQNTLQVSLGRFSSSVDPGGTAVFDTPFGEYLAQGVHQLQVSPCCAAELWLEPYK